MDYALTIVLDGLAYGMILFVISVGLALTMGLMRIVNLAHGAFAMAGGYVASAMTAAGGDFFLALLAAAAAGGALGAAAETTLYRPLYRKGELAQVLLTIGLVFMAVAALSLIFGPNYRTVAVPDFLDRPVDIGFRLYPAYRLFVIAVGLALALALWLIVDRSRLGAVLRAAVDNQRMARSAGIDVDRLFTVTFVGGSALAGLGGAIGAEFLPLEAFYPLRYLVLFLVVVIVGGTGGVKGVFAAAVALGMADTAAKFLLPHLAPFALYGIVIVLLLVRPHGLIAARAAA